MKDKNGITLLHYAIMNGHHDTVRALLEGVDSTVVSTKNDQTIPLKFASTVVSTKNETTPLMFPCEFSNNKELLHFGADPNVKKRNWCSPFIIASKNGHSDVVELLLKAKVDVNACLEEEQQLFT